jgi:hypothetical protein
VIRDEQIFCSFGQSTEKSFYVNKKKEFYSIVVSGEILSNSLSFLFFSFGQGFLATAAVPWRR